MSKIILITNDDGITSGGIEQLARAAKNLGEVWVVAPASQQSAVSRRISYFDSIQVQKYDFPVEGVKAYSCTGTPADCVRVGIKLLKTHGLKPDFVFSGINDGFNVCSDIQYSGTAAAALEGSFWGIQSAAFSKDHGNKYNYNDEILITIMKELMEKPLEKNQIWNVNFPGCQQADCKGILWNRTVSFDDYYTDDYSVEDLGNEVYKYKVEIGRNWKGSEGTDLGAIINHYISIGVVNGIH